MAENRRDLPVPVRVTLTRPGGARTTEFSINVSAGGVCLQVRDPLAAGERVSLEFVLPPGGDPLKLEGVVVWCTEEEEAGVDRTRFREMGIRFEPTRQSGLERLALFTTQGGDSRR
jgi:uncharacterized protein (TIGR02266 family)